MKGEMVKAACDHRLRDPNSICEQICCNVFLLTKEYVVKKIS